MSTILLKADLDEVSLSELDNYSFKHVTRSDMRQLCVMEGFVDKYIQRPLSRWEQETLNDYTRLSMEQCMTIIKNSEDTATTEITGRHKNLPIEFLKENAHKLHMYYIEHQENIDTEFFAKHREKMDVNAFFAHRAELGDVLKFLSPTDDSNEYMRRAFNYRASRESIVNNILTAKPEADVVSLNKVLDEIFNHPVNVEYLTECYEKPDVSHTVRDVVRYYNNHHNNQYSTWSEFVAHARDNSDTALAEVWFKDSFAPRILSFIKG